MATCVWLPRELLLDPEFDFFSWYEGAVLEYNSEDSSFGPVESSDESQHRSCVSGSSMPGLRSVSDSSGSEFLMPDLQSVSDSDSEQSSTRGSMPGLQSVDDSSDEASEVWDRTHLVPLGDSGETFEDRLKYWVYVSEGLPVGSAPRSPA
jgi:hypothetical protein